MPDSIRRGKLKDKPFPDDVDILEWRFASYLDELYFPSNVYLKLDCTEAVESVSNKIVLHMQSIIRKTN